MNTLCSAHNWPRWDNDECTRFIETQRDMYRYIHNATLHLINLGYTIDEVGRMIAGESSDFIDTDGKLTGKKNAVIGADTPLPIPDVFAQEWCCHGFYGTFNHNAKAVYQRYIGWYDGNPSHLNRHTPVGRANRYVSAFGADIIQEKAKEGFDRGDYAWAAELYDYLLNADSTLIGEKIKLDTDKDIERDIKIKIDIEQIRHKYAETLRHLGYQSEAASWRNMYLTAAKEIEFQQPAQASAKNDTLAFSEATINAMTLEMILQYMGIMYNIRKAPQMEKPLTLRIVVKTGNKKEYAIARADKAILGYRIYEQLPDKPEPGIMIEGDKLTFFHVFVEGNKEMLSELRIENYAQEAIILEDFIDTFLTRFPLNFPIMTPKK